MRANFRMGGLAGALGAGIVGQMGETAMLQYYFDKPQDARIYEMHHAQGAIMPVHRHQSAYASLILSGGYIEYGVDGRIAVEEGDIIVHSPFDSHGDAFFNTSACALGVELPSLTCPGAAFVVRASNPQALYAEVGRRPDCAEEMVLHETYSSKRRRKPAESPAITRAAAQGWMACDGVTVRRAASQAGVSAEHFSRVFKGHFGVSPAAFRSEWRFRRAAAAIINGGALADIASEVGYADQSHMTRDFNIRANCSPGCVAAPV